MNDKSPLRGLARIALTVPFFLAACSDAPSDNQLIAKFQQSRPALEELVALMQANEGAIGCRTKDDKFLETPIGRRFTALERTADVHLMCDEKTARNRGFLFYAYDRGGIIAQGNELKGFAFVPVGADPVVPSLDDSAANHGDPSIAFRRLAGSWYLFHYFG